MQWLLLSVKIQKMISVWWFANKVTYHIDAERNPTGSIVGRTSNNEERSYLTGGVKVRLSSISTEMKNILPSAEQEQKIISVVHGALLSR